MGCNDKGALVPLAVDGELQPAEAAELDQHLARCAPCALEFARLKALRAALKEALPRPEAPAALRQRILAEISDEVPGRVLPFRRVSWPVAAATALAAACLAALATFALVHPTEQDRLAEEVVSGHMRAIASDHLTDFASADPRAVTPWLAGHSDTTPEVRDISADGYRLAGARLDYLGRDRTGALVYRHGAHVFSLYVLDTPKTPDGDTDAVTRRGYAVCSWTRNGLTYWAVADVDPEQLEAFEDLVTKKG